MAVRIFDGRKQSSSREHISEVLAFDFPEYALYRSKQFCNKNTVLLNTRQTGVQISNSTRTEVLYNLAYLDAILENRRKPQCRGLQTLVEYKTPNVPAPGDGESLENAIQNATEVSSPVSPGPRLLRSHLPGALHCATIATMQQIRCSATRISPIASEIQT